jgi:hypothetical protein
MALAPAFKFVLKFAFEGRNLDETGNELTRFQ